MKTFAFRLHPGQDLKAELIRFTVAHRLQAGVVLTCVGSLEHAVVRLAGSIEVRSWEEKLEILSLSGTLSPDGVHLHLAVADGEGRAFGGHLMEGCRVYTTAEMVIGELEDVRFNRGLDSATGYRELEIE